MKSSLKLNSTLFIIVFLFLTGCGEKKTERSDSPKGRTIKIVDDLRFISKQGEEITTLSIAIADEPNERNQGLMDVNELAQDAGMLFIFDKEELQSFWMANTPLPLDIMYVNNDSVIVRIYQNTTPFSETGLPSEAPARFVVETNGGYALTHGITEGDKVRF